VAVRHAQAPCIVREQAPEHALRGGARLKHHVVHPAGKAVSFEGVRVAHALGNGRTDGGMRGGVIKTIHAATCTTPGSSGSNEAAWCAWSGNEQETHIDTQAGVAGPYTRQCRANRVWGDVKDGQVRDAWKQLVFREC